MHGLGNDFVLLDYFLTEPESDRDSEYENLARKLCHRQFGVGGDGLLVVLPSERADARMRIFNPDGSEPEMCGNGIRCLARYVYERGYVRHNPVRVETLAGILSLGIKLAQNNSEVESAKAQSTKVEDAKAQSTKAENTKVESIKEKNAKVESIRVDMGEPILDPEFIPVRSAGKRAIGESLEAEGREFRFTAVSMGNPHCVIFGEDLSEKDFYHYGPLLEKHPLFPRKTNVEFITVHSRREMTMRVWERGAGPTLACGTGASASAVAAVLNDLIDREVTVHLPGGDLLIEWADDNHVYMTGPAAYAFRGVWLGD
ncbi:diaminopimelate epimerase [Peptococcaceae bacterium CEB3]|nr:diaminopimelate epimerase [Peptococcaceae bacterium CEB3]